MTQEWKEVSQSIISDTVGEIGRTITFKMEVETGWLYRVDTCFYISPTISRTMIFVPNNNIS
jgi:hypothetical protein